MSLARYYAMHNQYEKVVKQINHIMANGVNSKKPKFFVLKKKAHLMWSLCIKERSIMYKVINDKEDENIEYDQIYTDVLAQCSYWSDCSNRFYILAKNGY
jgi:hypothetical protein